MKFALKKSQFPPEKLFWSITMYKLPERLLMDNPIYRYSMGDRTEGFKSAPDGSLTFYIQHDVSQGNKKANGLPAPETCPIILLNKRDLSYLPIQAS